MLVKSKLLKIGHYGTINVVRSAEHRKEKKNVSKHSNHKNRNNQDTFTELFLSVWWHAILLYPYHRIFYVIYQWLHLITLGRWCHCNWHFSTVLPSMCVVLLQYQSVAWTKMSQAWKSTCIAEIYYVIYLLENIFIQGTISTDQLQINQVETGFQIYLLLFQFPEGCYCTVSVEQGNVHSL